MPQNMLSMYRIAGSAQDYCATIESLMNNSSPDRTDSPVVQKIARTREEREAAFRLIYHSYLRAGLCPPNDTGLRICPHQLLPNTETFISVVDGEVVATVSLIADSSAGLPMESIYKDQVISARRRGLYMGEISALADRREDHRRIIQNLCELTRIMTHFALRQGMSGFMLVSHPKHARFYKRFMAFESIGEIKSYQSVCNNLAEPLLFDFSNQGSAQIESLRRVLGEHLPAEELEPSIISAADRRYFLDIQQTIEARTQTAATQNTGTNVVTSTWHAVTPNTDVPWYQPTAEH